MVMSDKTAIVQLKISRIMILINIGSRGGTFQACKCGSDVHLPMIWTGNALKTGKMTSSIGSPALLLLLAPPTFKWKLPPCNGLH